MSTRDVITFRHPRPRIHRGTLDEFVFMVDGVRKPKRRPQAERTDPGRTPQGSKPKERNPERQRTTAWEKSLYLQDHPKTDAEWLANAADAERERRRFEADQHFDA